LALPQFSALDRIHQTANSLLVVDFVLCFRDDGSYKGQPYLFECANVPSHRVKYAR